jgi:hypothetical protein
MRAPGGLLCECFAGPSSEAVRRVLVTGMSGTGKSTALDGLSKGGFHTADTDDPGRTAWDAQDDGYVWREDRGASIATSTRSCS